MLEVAGGMVGCWLQITGCVHTNLRAKQAVPGSSISALQHEPALLHSCFHQRTHHCISQPERRGKCAKWRLLQQWKCSLCITFQNIQFLLFCKHELQFSSFTMRASNNMMELIFIFAEPTTIINNSNFIFYIHWVVWESQFAHTTDWNNVLIHFSDQMQDVLSSVGYYCIIISNYRDIMVHTPFIVTAAWGNKTNIIFSCC